MWIQSFRTIDGEKTQNQYSDDSRAIETKVPDQNSLRERDARDKARQQSNYDQHHRAKELSPLMAGQTVSMPDCNEEAKVVQEAGTRSYEVETSE